MGIASLVFGILAGLLCITGVGIIFAFIPGLIGCLFGFIGKKHKSTCAIGGLVVSLVTTIVSLFFFLIFFATNIL